VKISRLFLLSEAGLGWRGAACAYAPHAITKKTPKKKILAGFQNFSVFTFKYLIPVPAVPARKPFKSQS